MIVGGLIARVVAELRDAGRRLGGAIGHESALARRAASATRRARCVRGGRARSRSPSATSRRESQASTSRPTAAPPIPTYAWGADVVEVEVDPDTLGGPPGAGDRGLRGRPRHPPDALRRPDRGRHAPGARLGAHGRGQAEGRPLPQRPARHLHHPDHPGHAADRRPPARAPVGGRARSAPKGVGELPMDGGAPAVAQAIENATGIAVTDEIPATPERLLRMAAVRGRPWGGGG